MISHMYHHSSLSKGIIQAGVQSDQMYNPICILDSFIFIEAFPEDNLDKRVENGVVSCSI